MVRVRDAASMPVIDSFDKLVALIDRTPNQQRHPCASP
jgi:hypothetical protein